MSYIYAMSDIHGELDIFKETLKLVDLGNKDNKLILLGDYIDRGNKSCETLYFIKKLTEKYPNQVIALRGNHEEMFLELLFSKDFLLTSGSYNEIQNYLSDKELDRIVNNCNASLPIQAKIGVIYKEMIVQIRIKHSELIKWIQSLPYYYETKKQIYVHAGVDEEAEEYWKWGCEDDYFIWKYPHVTGYFYKDIIAGHISTAEISGEINYHKVFWDKYSHFYIDGQTYTSKIIPVLKYDMVFDKYSSFERTKLHDNSLSWKEYIIR